MVHVVLGLLILQSQTIYDINNAFKQGISLFYSASYGSIQTTIKNLLTKGFIEFDELQVNGRNKKVYSITPSGKEEFFQWILGETSINKLEVTALSKVYFLGLVESVEQKKAIILEIIEKIEMVEKSLVSLDNEIKTNEVLDSYKNILYYQVKTLDYGIQAHAFSKKWFEDLLVDLIKK